MSGPSSHLLDRDGVIQAFTLLAERLHRRGVVADVYIVGGAAMTLAYDSRRTTRDIDAVFEPHGVVLEAAREVARDLGLPPSWLNDQASVYMPRDRRGPEVFSRPGLRVQSAPPEHLLAMKILAGRRSDASDVRFLLTLLGVTSVEQALSVVAAVFPDEPVDDRRRAILTEALDIDA